MNRKKTHVISGPLLLIVMVGLLFSATHAFAAESTAGWRPIYDLVMRWVNFLILAFVIVKFGKAPLMNFLKGQQEETEKEIRLLENEKEAALIKVEETRAMVAESNTHFKVITERIVNQGEKKKQEIIHAAGEESRLMIASARRKIDSELIRAREQFREELVDAAVAVATNRLAGEYTQDDNSENIRQFVDSVGSD